MHTSIQEAMTSNPTSVGPTNTAAEAAQIMKAEDIGSLPIVEGDKLVGTLTDRDIAVRVVAEGRDPDETLVKDVATSSLITVDPEDDFDEAMRQMARHQVRRLAVVRDGRLVGVVAQADVARDANEKQTGEVVEEISK